jgi:hypothetical protein|nr:MAG TPA: hypothetical protein [Caudoviricetes sp.]
MKKYITEKLNNAKYEAIQSAKTTFKYLKEVRNNKLIQAIKQGKSNEQLKQIAINAVVDEIKLAIALKGYEGKLENFDVDLFIFRNFKKSLFSVTSTDLKAIRAAVKSFNNVSRVRLDEFNFINVEYIQVQVAESVTEELKDEPVPVKVESVHNETLLVPISKRVIDTDIEEVEYEEVPNTERKPSDFIVNQQRFVPNCGGRLFLGGTIFSGGMFFNRGICFLR